MRVVAGELGRRKPPDFEHVEKYPFSAVQAETVAKVERTLALPSWHWSHDQGQEGSCVGHGVAFERAISNSTQNRLLRLIRPARRYNPLHLWNEAKKIDVWPDTNPGDDQGTSVRAAYDVARLSGCQTVTSMRMMGETPVAVNPKPEDTSLLDLMLPHGVQANRWATTVDEVRTAISQGNPVAIGVDWYAGFDSGGLIQQGREWFLRTPMLGLGRLRGGHCVCLYGASDRREAFKVKNSWGRDYPLAWMPYTTLEKLLVDDGEACLQTDR